MQAPGEHTTQPVCGFIHPSNINASISSGPSWAVAAGLQSVRVCRPAGCWTFTCWVSIA